MAPLTKLDMKTVRAEIQRELIALRDAGMPLVYIENGLIVEERVLKRLSTSAGTRSEPRLEAAE